MRELEKHDRLSEKESLEAIQEKKQQQEIRYESSLKPLKGHTLWEINTKTLDISPAEYYQEDVVIDLVEWAKGNHQEDKFIKRLIKKKGCEYISALNPDSALKRYKERKGSASLPNSTQKLGFL